MVSLTEWSECVYFVEASVGNRPSIIWLFFGAYARFILRVRLHSLCWKLRSMVLMAELAGLAVLVLASADPKDRRYCSSQIQLTTCPPGSRSILQSSFLDPSLPTLWPEKYSMLMQLHHSRLELLPDRRYLAYGRATEEGKSWRIREKCQAQMPLAQRSSFPFLERVCMRLQWR